MKQWFSNLLLHHRWSVALTIRSMLQAERNDILLLLTSCWPELDHMVTSRCKRDKKIKSSSSKATDLFKNPFLWEKQEAPAGGQEAFSVIFTGQILQHPPSFHSILCFQSFSNLSIYSCACELLFSCMLFTESYIRAQVQIFFRMQDLNSKCGA